MTSTRPFHVAAHDDVEALVALLEEVVYVVEVHRAVPVGVRVAAGGTDSLDGVFDVVPLAAVRVVGAVPKGVSWHGARLHRTPSGRWRCSVVLDV